MDALLDANQVTQLLGVSRRTLESLLSREEGPVYLNIGRQRRWRPSDVDEWVKFRLKKPTSPQKLHDSNELQEQ